MLRIAVIDLQPLSCIGIQAYLQELLKDIECQTAYTTKAASELHLSSGLDLIILGLNRKTQHEMVDLIAQLNEAGSQIPVVIMYEYFDVAHLRQLPRHTASGLISKRTNIEQLAECMAAVLSGSSFMCEKTRQHIIDVFAESGSRRRSVQ